MENVFLTDCCWLHLNSQALGNEIKYDELSIHHVVRLKFTMIYKLFKYRNESELIDASYRWYHCVVVGFKILLTFCVEDEVNYICILFVVLFLNDIAK